MLFGVCLASTTWFTENEDACGDCCVIGVIVVIVVVIVVIAFAFL